MTRWSVNLATGIALAVGFAWLVGPPLNGAPAADPGVETPRPDARGAEASPAPVESEPVEAATPAATRAQAATPPSDEAAVGAEAECVGAPLRRVQPPYASFGVPPEALTLTRARFAVDGRPPLAAFRDVDGAWRVGYGRVVDDADTRIREAEAEQYIVEDLEDAAATVRELGAVALHRNEFAALVALAHDLGGDAFRRSIVLARVNAGDQDGVQTAWAALDQGDPALEAARQMQSDVFACGRGGSSN